MPHVLVVDREPKARELPGRALTSHGFRCDLASDGEEAMRLACYNCYAAVVTELRLPKRHGHALCTDLFRLPSPPSVLVCTELNDARLTRDLLRRGVHEVVLKPVNYEVLALKVESMIQHHAVLHARVAAMQPARKQPSGARDELRRIEAALVEQTALLGESLDRAFDTDAELPTPPRSMRELVHRLAEIEAASGDLLREGPIFRGDEPRRFDERRQERVHCDTIATAAPVTREGKRAGEPFKVALRDVSEVGARLLHTRATNASYLALRWNATQLAREQIRVITKVVRCVACSPFYDLGVEFVPPA